MFLFSALLYPESGCRCRLGPRGAGGGLRDTQRRALHAGEELVEHVVGQRRLRAHVAA